MTEAFLLPELRDTPRFSPGGRRFEQNRQPAAPLVWAPALALAQPRDLQGDESQEEMVRDDDSVVAYAPDSHSLSIAIRDQ